MMSTKVLQRCAVDDRACGCAEALLKYVFRVRTGDGVHRVKHHAETAAKKLAQGIEVKQFLHYRRVINQGIDYNYLGVVDALGSLFVNVDVGMIDRVVTGDFQRLLVDAL